MTGSPPGGPGSDPLGTIPLFNVNIPLTPARAAAIRRALASLDIIRAQRHDLDQREHQLITAARDAGATWQQIAAPAWLQRPAGSPTAPPRLGPRPRQALPVTDASATA